MRPRASILLAVIAVVVLLGGWYFGPHQTPATLQHVGAGALLFPGLASPLEGAAKITLRHAGKTLVLAREGDLWTVPARGSYPAKPGAVHALLARLVELRVLAKRTRDPKEFAALDLENPDEPGSKAGELTVFDAAGRRIVSLLVGRENFPSGGSGDTTVYVREPGKDQSWLAEGAFSLDADPGRWIDDAIANIDHERIARIGVTRGAEQLEFRAEPHDLVLVAPKDHPPLEASKLDSVWRSLENLTFSSVAAASPLPGTALGQTVFTLHDGTTLTASFATAKKDLWAHFTVQGTSRAASLLAAKVDHWNFRLGDWRASALVPKLSDLVAPKDAKP